MSMVPLLLCNSAEESPKGYYIKFNHFSERGYLEIECHVKKDSVQISDDMPISRLKDCKNVGEGEMYKISLDEVKGGITYYLVARKDIRLPTEYKKTSN